MQLRFTKDLTILSRLKNQQMPLKNTFGFVILIVSRKQLYYDWWDWGVYSS